MRFPLSPTHQTPLVNAIKFDASVADIAKRWKLHLIIFGLLPKREVDFRSDWALCSCRFAFATENICC